MEFRVSGDVRTLRGESSLLEQRVGLCMMWENPDLSA